MLTKPRPPSSNRLFARRPPLPPEFYCPIACDVLVEPVIAGDGHTYEKEALEVYLQHWTTSPLTGGALQGRPRPNLELLAEMNRSETYRARASSLVALGSRSVEYVPPPPLCRQPRTAHRQAAHNTFLPPRYASEWLANAEKARRRQLSPIHRSRPLSSSPGPHRRRRPRSWEGLPASTDVVTIAPLPGFNQRPMLVMTEDLLTDNDAFYLQVRELQARKDAVTPVSGMADAAVHTGNGPSVGQEVTELLAALRGGLERNADRRKGHLEQRLRPERRPIHGRRRGDAQRSPRSADPAPVRTRSRSDVDEYAGVRYRRGKLDRAKLDAEWTQVGGTVAL